jgi:hypothetical protein
MNKPKGGGLTSSVEPQHRLKTLPLPQKQESSGLGLNSSAGPLDSMINCEKSLWFVKGHLLFFHHVTFTT